MFVRPQFIAALTTLALTLIASDAFARSFRVDQTPGANYSCELCHIEANGLNEFGFDSFQFVENGNVIWSSLAAVDSDGDGYTNGEELGDPDGTWTMGDPIPSGQTDPNDPNDTLCGNGQLDGNEECEGSTSDMTCADINAGVGELSCNPTTCTFDTSACGSCGDGIVQSPREECDGTELADATCEAMGFTGGTVSCQANCQLNTSACEGEPADTGNNNSGGGGGMTPGGGPGFCGDGMRNNGEMCEGGDLGGASCASLGAGEGVLHCNLDCEFDFTSCSGGNGLSTSNDGVQPLPVQPGNTILMTGEACSSSGSRTPDGALVLVFALMLGVGIRRRR
jgi:hypothetical protein